jgi:hypothetical protein
MNIYVLVEGELGAKRLYAAWIPFANPVLNYANELADVVHNHFYVHAGFGWPGYYDRIRAAIEDVATLEVHGVRLFDRLVIAIDSEDMTLADKENEVRTEINSALTAATTPIDCRIVIQHFCVEAWALGNRRLVGGQPSALLSRYRVIHSVQNQDPELLPPLPAENLNRARFAYKYLRLLHTSRYHRASYDKSDPKVVAHQSYFNELVGRLRDTGHIASFDRFLHAFT